MIDSEGDDVSEPPFLPGHGVCLARDNQFSDAFGSDDQVRRRCTASLQRSNEAG